MPRKYRNKYLPDGSLNPTYSARSGPSGKRYSKFERAQFVAWDGEGHTDDAGQHHYTMLVSSVPRYYTISQDGKSLSTRKCLALFCAMAEDPDYKNAIHVGFATGYDVNMILKDCSRKTIERIWSGQWTRVCRGEFVVQYRPRKSFVVKRTSAPSGRKLKAFWLWDVFGFFQSSFVGAVRSYLGDHPTLSLIQTNKAKRSQFTFNDWYETLEYCRAECSTLVELMQRLQEYLSTANLKISRWDGAGACAAALLTRQNTQEAMTRPRPEVLRAAQYAYAGGRIELNRYGHAPDTPIYHYDINSAYPYAMMDVPNLQGAAWRHHTARITITNDFTMCYVRWAFSKADYYPFFWRSDDGAIYYPQSGEGWYWAPEVKAARLALQSGQLQGMCAVLEAWECVPRTSEKPFAWIHPLYRQRQEWKRDKIGAEKVLKLAINSLYGKTAQHTGATNGMAPKFHQLEWAGYITSRTRAALYLAAIPHLQNGNIIMLATDGIYSLVPLALPEGHDLGQWSFEQHRGITVVQSGVYWTYECDGSVHDFCRGFDRGSLDVGQIVAAWRRRQLHYPATLSRFVTMGSAIMGTTRSRSWQRWRTWDTSPRLLSLTMDGTKRSDFRQAQKPHTGLRRTIASLPATQAAGQYMSCPYELPWVDGELEYGWDSRIDGVPARVAEIEAHDSAL